MVGAAIASLVIAGVTTAVGGLMAYDQNKRAENSLKTQAKAVKAQSEADAAEMSRQARLEDTRAGIAQISGEMEAEKRSRLLASDIGSMYANFAGNGLLVDGGAKDTVGSALKTTVAEGQFDISTIRDNAAMEVWTHGANASSLRASAANRIIAGRNEASMLRSQAKSARHMAKLGLWQTATGLPLVDGSGFNMAASSIGLFAGAGKTPAQGGMFVGGGTAPAQGGPIGTSTWNTTKGFGTENFA